MTKFMYLRDKNRNPIGCVAVNSTDNLISYQISVLNPKDKFDRYLGRNIASGRLEKNPINIYDINPNKGVIQHVMEDLSSERDFPTRAVNFARKWIRKLYSNFDDIEVNCNGN